MRSISIKKSTRHIGKDIINSNNVIYDKQSLINAEEEMLRVFKENNLKIFTNLCSKQPMDNMSDFLTTKLDTVSTVGRITNINEYDVDIELFDNNIFDNENLNPEDFRVAYRLLGNYNDDNKFVVNKIVGIDILPKEKFIL